MKRAIFFDLDGTLWNAIEQMKEAYNEVMEKNNLPYRFTYDDVKSYMGLTPEETALIAFKDRPLEEGIELFKMCYKAELEYIPTHSGILYPHVEDVLSSLIKKYPLYIVSNADKGYIEMFLKATGLGKYFISFLQAGDTGLAKWQNILLLKEKEGIDEVIYLGDTLKDKIESEKANATFIHAAYGFGKIENTKYKINSFKEIEKEIEKIFLD